MKLVIKLKLHTLIHLSFGTNDKATVDGEANNTCNRAIIPTLTRLPSVQRKK